MSIKKMLKNRKRVTQIFPALIPLRVWQRKKFFYAKMKFDNNKYSKTISKKELPYKLDSIRLALINPNSGFDIKYQENKAFNLKLASLKITKLIIKPNEVFSFWQLVKDADKDIPYKDGLSLIDDKINTVYGGGLCQLSNILFWLFLHSPLKIIERHPHSAEHLKPISNEILPGIDSTVYEGWLDLKVKNNTNYNFQIIITFDDKFIYAKILSSAEAEEYYKVRSENLSYIKKNDGIYRYNEIYKDTLNKDSKKVIKSDFLYKNTCKIEYELNEETELKKFNNFKAV